MSFSGTTIKTFITEETLYELLPGNFDIAIIILKFSSSYMCVSRVWRLCEVIFRVPISNIPT